MKHTFADSCCRLDSNLAMGLSMQLIATRFYHDFGLRRAKNTNCETAFSLSPKGARFFRVDGRGHG
jgi:hypothetical protein